MYPELFRLNLPYFGEIPITGYGIWLAVGMLFALFAASRLAARDGLPREKIYDLGLWTLIGGLLGAKVLMLFVEGFPHDFSLLSLLDFVRSGGVYYGGFLGGLLTLVLLIRFYKLPFWKVADAFAPGVALGQAFGRQGCFAAGCCWGKPTDAFCGVHFTAQGHDYTGVPTVVSQLENDGQREFWATKLGGYDSHLHLHPTQLYESFTMLLVFGILVYLHKRKKFDGQILIAYGIIYSVVRFIIEFWRDDPRGEFFGFSTSQIISVIVGAGAIAFMIVKLKRVEKVSEQN